MFVSVTNRGNAMNESLMLRDADAAPEFLLYQSEDGVTRVQVRLQGGTVWLSLTAVANLFQTSKPNISMHIRNILRDGELSPEATVKRYLTVQTEGDRQVERLIDHYNLDVITCLTAADLFGKVIWQSGEPLREQPYQYNATAYGGR
jgi:hypothetical protein